MSSSSSSSTDALTIKEVSARTGVAAGTIRMWEARHGFPRPSRTSGGYRLYTAQDVEVIRRVVAYRRRGLSMPAALERALAAEGPSDRPSIYAAVAASEPELRPHLLTKRTLISLSRAIEDEAIARAASPIVLAAFQQEAFYRAVEHRYDRLAESADAVVVLADFPRLRETENGPAEVPIQGDDALSNEWAVIVDAPGYCACLMGWERPGRRERGGEDDLDRRFESVWTIDPRTTRRAAEIAARLAGRAGAKLGRKLEDALSERPLAVEEPAPGLTALTNRMVDYLEAA